jgi:hypothetical protein
VLAPSGYPAGEAARRVERISDAAIVRALRDRAEFVAGSRLALVERDRPRLVNSARHAVPAAPGRNGNGDRDELVVVVIVRRRGRGGWGYRRGGDTRHRSWRGVRRVCRLLWAVHIDCGVGNIGRVSAVDTRRTGRHDAADDVVFRLTLCQVVADRVRAVDGAKGYPDGSYDPWWPGEEDVENSTYVAFDSLDDAFTFLHETAEMLVSAVGPSDLVLRDAELALEPFEPDEQGSGLLRGCVRFHPALLQTITNLWGSPLNEL